MFIELLNFNRSLNNMVNVCDHTRCLSLNNRICMARPTLTELNIDEYNQDFCPFMINLDSCNRRCIFFDDAFGRICTAHNTEDVNKDH